MQMYCQKCGQENPDGSQVCRACGAALISPPIQAPGLNVKSSGMAIAALVLGIMSIFTCALTAIPAIILGIISLVKIEKSGGRLVGRNFSILGVVIPVCVGVILGILLPAL
jgi:uncharacterized membrane protein YvbJ